MMCLKLLVHHSPPEDNRLFLMSLKIKGSVSTRPLIVKNAVFNYQRRAWQSKYMVDTN